MTEESFPMECQICVQFRLYDERSRACDDNTFDLFNKIRSELEHPDWSHHSHLNNISSMVFHFVFSYDCIKAVEMIGPAFFDNPNYIYPGFAQKHGLVDKLIDLGYLQWFSDTAFMARLVCGHQRDLYQIMTKLLEHGWKLPIYDENPQLVYEILSSCLDIGNDPDNADDPDNVNDKIWDLYWDTLTRDNVIDFIERVSGQLLRSATLSYSGLVSQLLERYQISPNEFYKILVKHSMEVRTITYFVQKGQLTFPQ